LVLKPTYPVAYPARSDRHARFELTDEETASPASILVQHHPDQRPTRPLCWSISRRTPGAPKSSACGSRNVDMVVSGTKRR
jgi:hypothetical protein